MEGRAVMLCAAVLAGSCFGCGGSDEDQVREAYRDYQEAFRVGDYRELCALTTPAARRQLGLVGHEAPDGCERDLRDLAERVREGRRGGASLPVISSLGVNGDRATATVTLHNGARTRIPFARRHGRWRIDAVYGAVPAGRQVNKFNPSS